MEEQQMPVLARLPGARSHGVVKYLVVLGLLGIGGSVAALTWGDAKPAPARHPGRPLGIGRVEGKGAAAPLPAKQEPAAKAEGERKNEPAKSEAKAKKKKEEAAPDRKQAAHPPKKNGHSGKGEKKEAGEEGEKSR